jgi:mRNA-degrading endonuclease RelE of RelBE toxin-antitoxin system
MQFIIASTFQESLARLDGRTRDQVKRKVYDLQQNPRQPGYRLHRLDRAIDRGFHSARVNTSVRMILHIEGDSVCLCHVDQHDAAYRWAENRRLEEHPRTGAIYFAVVEEREEVVIRRVEREVEPALLAQHDDDYLLGLGVPAEWLPVVKSAGEQTFLDTLANLPREASERLLRLATGEMVPLPRTTSRGSGFEHPDTKRRFAVIESDDDLKRALDAPAETWVVFLHPSQREAVHIRTAGPFRVTGAAGTGKSVVALHRVRHLLETHQDDRILLTSYSRTLTRRLDRNLDLLVRRDSADRRRVDVKTLHQIAVAVYRKAHGANPVIIDARDLDRILQDAIERFQVDRGREFMRAEWEHVVDAQHLVDEEAYLTATRSGRGSRLLPAQRRKLWQVFDFTWRQLEARGAVSFATLCHLAASDLERRGRGMYEHVVVDECQDFGMPELRLVRALAPEGDDDLYFCGDDAQQIFRMPFPWRSVGIDVIGRSMRMTVNYRTTEQIRNVAESLLPDPGSDHAADADTGDAVSLLRGPQPRFEMAASVAEEVAILRGWIRDVVRLGILPEEIAIFSRRKALLDQRAAPAVRQAGLLSSILAQEDDHSCPGVALASMHRAKGLEFRAVAVIGVERGLVPEPCAVNSATDPQERTLLLDQERQLLYVAMTRAREELLVTGVGESCEFLPGYVVGLSSQDDSDDESEMPLAIEHVRNGFRSFAKGYHPDRHEN